MAAADMGGVCAGADQDEIVPGNLPSVPRVPLRDELLLGFRIVHQHQVGIAARRRRQGLAGPLCQDPNRNAGLFGEFR